MYTFILIVHIGTVVVLIGLILVQRGRSSGLVEALGGVESIFGTKTNAFLVKATVFLAVLFFLTSISLVYLSKRRSTSLVEKSLRTAVPSKTSEKTVSPQTSKVNEGNKK